MAKNNFILNVYCLLHPAAPTTVSNLIGYCVEIFLRNHEINHHICCKLLYFFYICIPFTKTSPLPSFIWH